MTVKLKPDQKKAVITDADSLYPIMREVLMREKGIDKNRERSWVASLAANKTLVNLELISLGNTKNVQIEPTAVFGLALQKDSKGIIIIHNHPGGSLMPSKEDDNFTKVMLAIGQLVQCPVLDHLIVTENGYYSYADRGRLQQFSGLINPFDPRPEKEIERLQELLLLHKKAMAEMEQKHQREIKKLTNGKKTVVKKKGNSKK